MRMRNSPQTSRILRIATLLLSLSVFAVLIVQASLTAGCGGAESSQKKPADPSAEPPAAKPNAPASPKPNETQQIDVGPPQMGGSKSGAILWPEEPKRDVQAKSLNAPPSNVNAKR